MDRVAIAVAVFFVSVAIILFSGYIPAQIAGGVVVLASGRSFYEMIIQHGRTRAMRDIIADVHRQDAQDILEQSRAPQDRLTQ